MSKPYLIDRDEGFNSKLLLGTTWTPGTVTLQGHDAFENWDIVQGKGSKGGTSKLQADGPRSFQAVFRLVSDGSQQGADDVTRWETDIEPLLRRLTAGPKPLSIPIYHPDLARNSITEISSGGVGGFVHDGNGGVTVTVKFVEHVPPKPAPPKKAEPKPGSVTRDGGGAGGGQARRDPNAAAKRELAELLAEAKKP